MYTIIMVPITILVAVILFHLCYLYVKRFVLIDLRESVYNTSCYNVAISPPYPDDDGEELPPLPVENVQKLNIVRKDPTTTQAVSGPSPAPELVVASTSGVDPTPKPMVVEPAAPAAAGVDPTCYGWTSMPTTAAASAVQLGQQSSGGPDAKPAEIPAVATTASPVTVVPPTEVGTVSDAQRGWRLARRCGTAVRLDMGCPTLSAANKVIATQRIVSWLKENNPRLRYSEHKDVVFKALVVALSNSDEEVQASMQLQSREAVRRRHIVESVHQVPRFNVFPEVERLLGLTVPATQNF